MPLTLHNLKLDRHAKHRLKRVGRGNASGHGTYSGRGGKGQTARTGGSKGLKLKGFRALLLRTPKLGGFRSPYAKPAVAKLAVIDKYYPADSTVTKEDLLAKKLVAKISAGVKIIGPARVTKKLNIVGCQVTQSVREAIEAAGGTVENVK